MDKQSADARIQAALARDDRIAVELIWDRYGSDLLAFLAARLCCRHDAEDVLQSLFVRIVDRRRVLARARYLDGYLYRMACNEAATYLRNHRRRKDRTASAEPWLIARETDEPAYDRVEQLQVMLSRLPQAQREVMVLKVYRDKTFQEIARLLDIPLNTAASRYRYGMERLRELLKDRPL